MGLLNGAGPFVAVSALPMLLGLWLREGRLAQSLRRLAFVLALALPGLFMAVAAALYLREPGPVYFDFDVNHRAALLLYGQNSDPYSIHTVWSFPFPTFYTYWLLGGLGRLNISQAWVAWWLVNGVLWLVCAVLLWRTLPVPVSQRERDTLLYAAAAVPGMTTLWQGQTALLILAGLTTLHLAIRRGRWIVGGVGLAWAALVKPQLALVGVGLAVWIGLRARRGENVRGPVTALIAAGVVAVALIGLTLLLPGGVTLDTYREFFAETLPRIARPDETHNVIGSPAFVLSKLAFWLGASERNAELISSGVTVLVFAAAVFWTVRRASRPLIEIAAGWAAWAMVAPRVAWTWYATWCLPFFWLALQENFRQRRSTLLLTLFVVVLMLLDLQLESVPASFVTIALLMAVLWQSFRTTPVKSPKNG